MRNNITMTLNEYQIEAKKTAAYPNSIPPYVYITLGLCGEVGEVTEKLKKLIRNNEGDLAKFNVDDFKKELGDVLWYLSCLADEFNITLEDVAMANIEKLRDRASRGVIKSEGDNR